MTTCIAQIQSRCVIFFIFCHSAEADPIKVRLAQMQRVHARFKRAVAKTSTSHYHALSPFFSVTIARSIEVDRLYEKTHSFSRAETDLRFRR